MVWETMWKPLDVEKMIKEINLFWDSFFRRGLKSTNKSINIVETKEIVIEKVRVSNKSRCVDEGLRKGSQ